MSDETASTPPADGLSEILPPVQTPPVDATLSEPAAVASPAPDAPVDPTPAPTDAPTPTEPAATVPDPATTAGPAADPAQDPVAAPQGGAVVQPAAVASPALIASICIYREPDGRLSLVREEVPQAFFEVGNDLLAEAKAYLHNRVGSYIA